MMSLNMLIEFGEAFDFTGAQFTEWCKEAGFSPLRDYSVGGARKRSGGLQVGRYVPT